MHGIIQTLHYRNFLEQNPANNKYTLGVELYNLGIFYLSQTDILTQANVFGKELAERTSKCIDISVLINGEVINVAQYIAENSFVLIPQLGAVTPAYCTSSGKILLSEFPESKIKKLFGNKSFNTYTKYSISTINELLIHLKLANKHGYALSDQESILGMSSIAAPIRDRSKRICAAISISGSTAEIMDEDNFDEYVEILLDYSNKLSSVLE